MQRIGIIVAHEDDEAILAGGLISKTASKDEVVIISVVDTTEGQRRAIIRNSEKFGFRRKSLGIAPWNIHIHEVAQAIYREIQGFQPDLIVTHNPGDTHQEHRAVVEAVEIATRQIDMCKEGGHNFRWNVIYGLGVGAYENSDNWLLPNYFVILSETEAVSKVDMLNEYGTEMRGIRTADNTLIDLRYWGRFVGAEYAEPFHVKRICVR